MKGELGRVKEFDRPPKELVRGPEAPARSGDSVNAHLFFLSPGEWVRVGITIVALVYVAAASVLVVGGPTPVSAQEILGKAKAALVSPAAAGVESFVLTESLRTVPGNLPLNTYARLNEGQSLSVQVVRSFQAPNLWRSEYEQQIVNPDGTKVTSERFTRLSDGKDMWHYDEMAKVVTINPVHPHLDPKGEVGLFGQTALSLQSLFGQVGTCYDPRVTGSEMIATRAAYVVDLGNTQCNSASGHEIQGRLVVWVDKETFLVLKMEQHSGFDDKVILTNEVTSVQYSVILDPAQFKFTAPDGVTVMDNQPSGG